MKKKMMIIAFGITIAAIAFVLFFVTIYFQYDTQRKQIQIDNLSFVSFPGYEWINFSKKLPYSSTRMISSWIFQIIPLKLQEGEHYQYTISKIRFEAFSENQNQWLLLSENEVMREFEEVDQRYYVIQTDVPASVLLHEEIKIQIVVIVRDLDNNSVTQKEIKFLHKVIKEKKYSNFIWDTVSSA